MADISEPIHFLSSPIVAETFIQQRQNLGQLGNNEIVNYHLGFSDIRRPGLRMYSVNILVLILQQQLKENHPVMRVFRKSGPVFVKMFHK